MFAKLFLLFAILPIVEIALLINVGEIVGGWNTVAIVIVTAFIGAHLVRQQGINTLATAQNKMRAGEMPGQEMAEGLLLLVAGVLLVTPGFITDGIGFLLSMPLTRPLIAKSLVKQFGHKIIVSQTGGSPFQGQTFYQQSSFHQEHQANEQARGQQEYQPGGNRSPFSDMPNSKGPNEVIEGEFQRKDE